jgi:hypothetical protein
LARASGGANGAEFTLRTLNRGDQKDPAVARALQRRDPGLGRHFPQAAVAQSEWLADRPADPQLVSSNLQIGRRKVTADVEQVGRSQKGVNLIDGGLEIDGFFLTDG